MAKTVDNFSTIEQFRLKYNELATDVGEVSGLRPSLSRNLVDAMNDLEDKAFFFQEFIYTASASQTAFTGADTFDNNNAKFFQSLSDGGKFQVRREEEISSTNFFCRVNNKRYNFSSNPTYFTGSDGSFVQPTYFKDPKVYITTVGLYNDDNELLAVAKLSKPILKSYSREAIIKVKLDF